MNYENFDLEKLSKPELITLLQSILKMVEVLQKENALLRAEIVELKHKTNSNNSSMPPSSDLTRPSKSLSLRKKSGKKKGGQFGHKGSSLKMMDTADEYIKLVPTFCEKCGKDLNYSPEILNGKRQVLDIPPPVKPICTQYNRYSKICNCGCENTADFPTHVSAPIQYGPRINSLISYFSVRQYIPYQRMKECFKDVFALNICEATMVNSLKKMGTQLLPEYNTIKQNITESAVIGSDETGAKVNGDKGWFWVWQNERNTYIVYNKSRGFKVILNEFPDGLPKAILQSDSLSTQLKTKTKGKQLCFSHLEREVNSFIEKYHDDWSKKLLQIIKTALKLKPKITDYGAQITARDNLEKELNDLLEYDISKQPEKIKPFQKRLIKRRDAIFQFLYHASVSPDNNASERAIRNIKVKQKVSGQFISPCISTCFAVIRSIIDTCIKRNKNILEHLFLAALKTR